MLFMTKSAILTNNQKLIINEINVDTPVNEAIVRLIHEIETGKLEPSIDNIGYLGGKATT